MKASLLLHSLLHRLHQLFLMLVDEVVDNLDGLRACLALDDAVLDGDGEVIRAAAHVNVRRGLASLR